MPKKKKYIWPVGPKNESSLSVELRPAVNDIIFIERLGGELIAISLDEAHHLAQVLPRVVAEAHARRQQLPITEANHHGQA